MNPCPVAGCTNRIPGTLAFCRTHWFTLPGVQRNAIWDSYRAFLRGQRHHAEHRELIDRAADWLAGKEAA